LNLKNGILYFHNYHITISEQLTNRNVLYLKAIFKDIKKVWNYDEIADSMHEIETYDKNSWNKYYQLGKAINTKVTSATSIKNFLVIKTKNVQVNPKYLVK
jgi:hypothetical protein